MKNASGLEAMQHPAVYYNGDVLVEHCMSHGYRLMQLGGYGLKMLVQALYDGGLQASCRFDKCLYPAHRFPQNRHAQFGHSGDGLCVAPYNFEPSRGLPYAKQLQQPFWNPVVLNIGYDHIAFCVFYNEGHRGSLGLSLSVGCSVASYDWLPSPVRDSVCNNLFVSADYELNGNWRNRESIYNSERQFRTLYKIYLPQSNYNTFHGIKVGA